MDDRKKELTDAVDCPEHNELFGLNRVNPNQQLMHLMNKIYKKINLEDFGNASFEDITLIIIKGAEWC